MSGCFYCFVSLELIGKQRFVSEEMELPAMNEETSATSSGIELASNGTTSKQNSSYETGTGVQRGKLPVAMGSEETQLAEVKASVEGSKVSKLCSSCDDFCATSFEISLLSKPVAIPSDVCIGRPNRRKHKILHWMTVTS